MKPNLQLDDDDISQADDISSLAPSSVVGSVAMKNHFSMQVPASANKSPRKFGFGPQASGRVSPLTRAAMNRMTQNLPQSSTKYVAGRVSTNLQPAKSPRGRMEMWKEPEDDEDQKKEKKEKKTKFRQVVIEKDECEIFEAQDLSDESLTDSTESLDDDDDDEDEDDDDDDDEDNDDDDDNDGNGGTRNNDNVGDRDDDENGTGNCETEDNNDDYLIYLLAFPC